MTDLPTALLVDLDDTILSFSSVSRDFWREALEAHWPGRLPRSVDRAREAIERASTDYWSDAARAAHGRLDLFGSRRDVARRALSALGFDEPTLVRIADTYTVEKERAMAPLPGAIASLRRASARGHRLALVTNGAGPDQRRKLQRFHIAGLFDAIVVEGEWGVGKPHPSVFREALRLLGAAPEDSMMVGDNLEADVEGAAAAGLKTAWIDSRGVGLPPGTRVVPDMIAPYLADVMDGGHSGTRGA